MFHFHQRDVFPGTAIQLNREHHKRLQFGILWGTGRDNWQVYCGGNLLGSGTQAQRVHLAECSPFVLIHLFSVSSGQQWSSCCGVPTEPAHQPSWLREVLHLLVTKRSWGKLCNGDGSGVEYTWLCICLHFLWILVLDSLCVRISVWASLCERVSVSVCVHA
jgi:hypothetical protein